MIWKNVQKLPQAVRQHRHCIVWFWLVVVKICCLWQAWGSLLINKCKNHQKQSLVSVQLIYKAVNETWAAEMSDPSESLHKLLSLCPWKGTTVLHGPVESVLHTNKSAWEKERKQNKHRVGLLLLLLLWYCHTNVFLFSFLWKCFGILFLQHNQKFYSYTYQILQLIQKMGTMIFFLNMFFV